MDEWERTIEEYNASAVVGVADKLLGCVSRLLDDGETDQQTVKLWVSVLKDLRDIKEFGSEIALRKAKCRKYERDCVEESETNDIRVVFEAGEEEWNE